MALSLDGMYDEFTFNFSGSDNERDEVTVAGYDRERLAWVLREIAEDAKALSELLDMDPRRGPVQRDYTVATRSEAATLASAVDVIEQAYREEDTSLPGDLRNLRYRLRGRRF